MKVLFIMEYGIPEYRDFLFKSIIENKEIDEILVLHTDIIYKRQISIYPNKKLKFIGSNKLGLHLNIKELFSIVKNYDIILSSYNIRILTCWLPIFFFPQKKWIFWGKGLGESNSLLVKKIRKIIANRANKILVYNDFKKEQLISEIKVDRNKVETFYNSLKISNPGFNVNSNKEYFLYFGRIQHRKGLTELIDAFTVYKKNNPSNKYKLRFVGNGAYGKVLKKKVVNSKFKNSIEFFNGVYSDKEIREHFEKAIAYVSPNNVGLGVVNSFAYGVPVITVKGTQVAPEFYLLDSTNSIICDDFASLPKAFEYISDKNVLESFRESCYNYYLLNLKHEKMISCFLNNILE